MEPTLKIRDNLFIEGGKSIISYETHVATIENGRIVEHGKYSRTTSRQISYISGLTKLPVTSSKDKQGYWKFEFGVRCQPGSDHLSPEYSVEVIKSMQGGKTFFQALVLCTPQKRKDKAIVDQYFRSIGYDLKTLQDSRDLGIVFA